MIEKLVMKAPIEHPKNEQVKSIVRPDRVLSSNHAHYVFYKPGYFHVNEKGVRVRKNKFITPVSVEKLRINHYWTRDEEFFQKTKIQRNIDFGSDAPVIEIFMKDKVALNQVYDDIMLRFVPKMKERMFGHSNIVSGIQ